MKKVFQQILLVLFSCFFFSTSFAADKFWIKTTASNWNNGANWSPGGVPANGDRVFFDGAGSANGNCTLDVATANLGQFRIEGTYSGSFIQGANAITVAGVSGVGAIFSSGIFSGGSASVTITGSVTQSGGTFNASTGTTTFNGAFAQSGGTFSPGSGTLNINGAFSQSAGTFSASTATISVTGAFTLSSSASFTSTSNTLTINGNLAFQNSSSFNPNTGTVKLVTTGTLTTLIGITSTFYNLELGTNGSTATYTVGNSGGNTLDVINDLTLSGNDALIINGAGALKVTSNGRLRMLNNSTAGGGTGTIVMDGTGNQTIQGASTIYKSPLGKLAVNKASGQLSISNYVTLTNNLTYSAGTTTVTTTGSTLIFTGAGTNGASNTTTINGSGTFALNHLTFETVSSTDRIFDITGGLVLTVAGDLKLIGTGSTGSITINTGTINASGNITISNLDTDGGGSGTIGMVGGNNQALEGPGNTINQGKLCKVSISKSAGAVTLKKTVTVGNDWSCSLSGTASVTATNSGADSSTIVFNRAATATTAITHSGSSYTFYNVIFDASSSAVGTFTIPTSFFTVNNYLSITGTGSVILNTGTIAAKKHVVVSNTGLSGGGTANININGASIVQTLRSTVSIQQGKLPIVTMNKTGSPLTLNLIGTITFGNDLTLTAGTLSAGTSNVVFSGASNSSITIGPPSGTFTFYDVTFEPASNSGINTNLTFTIPTLFTVNNLLKLSKYSTSTASIILNTGNIEAFDDITITNTGTSGGGNATIKSKPASDASNTLQNSTSTEGQGALPNFIIDRSGKTLVLLGTISCAGNWTYTNGAVTSGSSVVAFTGNFNLDGENGSGPMSFFDVSFYGSSNTRTLAGKLDVNGALNIKSGAILSHANASYDITVAGNWINSGTFTPVTNGEVIFDGSVSQGITNSSGETFNKLKVNKSGGSTLTLNNGVTVTNVLTLSLGIVNSSAGLLTLTSAVTATAVSGTPGNSAYVSGPMKKIGNTAFTFPIGKSSLYHPLSITAPCNASDAFTAEYFAASSGSYPPGTKISSLDYVSDCEYWMLNRTAGTCSTIVATLAWNTNGCNIDADYLQVAGWDNAKWTELGSGTVVNNGTTGTISTLAAVTSYPVATNNLPLTLATKENYATLQTKLDGGYYQTKLSKLYFTYYEEYKKEAGDMLIYNIYNASNNVKVTGVPNMAVKFGENKLTLNLATAAGGSPLSAGFYILEVINEKNEKQYLRFKK